MNKRTYYCAMTEFYKNGTLKGVIITRDCKEKPKNTIRFFCFVTGYMDWFTSFEQAEAFLAKQSAKGKAA